MAIAQLGAIAILTPTMTPPASDNVELALLFLIQVIQLYLTTRNGQIVARNGQLTMGNREAITQTTSKLDDAHSCLHKLREEIKALRKQVEALQADQLSK